MSVWLYEPFYDFERMFDEHWGRHGRAPGQAAIESGEATAGGGAVRAIKPRMDLHEDHQNNAVTATFEFPGLKKDDVGIDVRDNRLMVTAESKMESDKEEGGYAVRERRYGKFSRTLQLPQGVKDSDIKAKMENGVLCVTFPKAAPEQAAKKINIS